MLLPGFCRIRTRIYSPIWMWVAAVVMMTGTTVDANDDVYLHPHSKPCTRETSTTLRCDITDNTVVYLLDSFEWNGTSTVTIWNADRLVLKNPLCDLHIRNVKIRNSSSVTTKRGEDNCAQRLDLQDCTGVTIEDGANWVKMDSSKAGRIALESLNRLQLKDSLVNELSVAVVRDNSRVTNSEIEVVKKLLINGSVQLTMDDSSLGQVEEIIYDSIRASTLKNVIVDSVASKGFLVHNGVLTLDNCTIGSMASHGLLVVNGADLILQDCEIQESVFDGLMVSDGGNVYLKNVTIGQEREIYLTFLDVSLPLYPLAFLFKPSVPPNAWIAIALFIGLVVGAVVGVGVMMFVMRRRQALSSGVDSMELKTRKETTGQNAFNPNTYKHVDQLASTTPSDSTGKKKDDNAPPPPPSQRPPRFPGPPPHETSPPMRDERADLPLPPPPPPPPDDDEELYDEVQDTSKQMGNLSALTGRMPKLSHMKKSFP